MYIAVANKVEAKAGAPSPRISLPHVWLTGPTRLYSPEISYEFSFSYLPKQLFDTSALIWLNLAESFKTPGVAPLTPSPGATNNKDIERNRKLCRFDF